MPEGPEIKRLSSRLKKVLVDKALASVEFTYQGLGAYNQELLSQKIVDVDSRGKALIISFSEGLSIYSHNQLYGKWLIVRSGKVPKTNRSQRLVISTNRHSAFLFSASDIQVLKTVDLGSHPFLSKLGPDALGNATTKNQVLEQLISKRFRRRSLGALLLDQGFIAGLGNYLRSEILFNSKLHPLEKPMNLSEGSLDVLARNILGMTRQAYETSGVTNDLGRVSQLKEKGVKRSRFRFAIFSRNKMPCYVCNKKIIREEVNGRRLYLCQGCQPKPL
tara:strand:- start:315 stop:1142 length:828 start_codon:yes stop_codon:yes gene_type:complete